MKIYNTLTNQKEDFVPIHKGEVRMYVCGVTVYSPIHLGHIRAYIAYDVMAEYFTHFKGLKTFYVRNITDVGSVVGDNDEGEDKIELKAKEEKVHPLELVDMNIRGMWQGLDEVRCRRPNISPRATGHIVEIIEAVQKMINSGYAYELDGNVYLDVSKISDYGVLSGNTIQKLSAGARIEYDKRKHTPYDFAVWKKAQKTSVLKWNSPWGVGYPGWHIECSVMSQKYLGNNFDIHGGGRDLQFPHHENEIAQSKALGLGSPAKYWVHAGMLNAEDGTKMSKSKGNDVTVEDALKKYGARNLRWLCAFSHYRSPIAFSEKAFSLIENEYQKIENFFYSLNSKTKTQHNELLDSYLKTLKTNFEKEMDDDFNCPNALTEIFNFIKLANTEINNSGFDDKNVIEITNYFEKINKVFKTFDFLAQKQPKIVNNNEDKIKSLIDERNAFRAQKNYQKADEIKSVLISMGVELTDNKDGTTTFRIK